MVSRVTYRPFDEDDFNDIAQILRAVWHSKAPTPGYAFLEACYDLARCLSISTFSQVALIDGTPRGIVLARSTNLRIPISTRWQLACDGFFNQMRTSEPQAAAAYRRYSEELDRVNAGLLEKSGLPSANEVILLAVDSEARGLGIGGVLLDAASSYLASRRASKAFLYTDTGCSWPFYEQHGLKRAAAHKASREERKLLPKEMYVYGLDLSE